MSAEPKEWTLKGFCQHFKSVHAKMQDHCFAWILGAGASKPSGIPTGAELVDRWLHELHEREDHGGLPFEQWAHADKLDIPDFSLNDAASFYPRVFERRFRDFPDEGYADLESVMSGKDPCPGYSILAKILETRHRVVITTNFDNLVADAVAIYTNTYPMICGHESLTRFVRVRPNRPVVCKIHRDLLFAPQNDSESLKRLNEDWTKTLTDLFKVYTPIVIGYGGNDDTLMGLLETLDPETIKGHSIWCYYDKGPAPSERICNVVARLHGVLVPAPGFDRLMVLLGEALGIGPLNDYIESRARQRAEQYRKRMEGIRAEVKPPPITLSPGVATVTVTASPPDITTTAVAEALDATLKRATGWWAWELKAQSELDPVKREGVYREGIKNCPNSAELLGNFANFLTSERKNHNEAEQLYYRALDLDPSNAFNTGNFAFFLETVRKNYDVAEQLYRRALELNSNNAKVAGNFADFLTDIRKNHDEAERLFRRALKVDPNNAINTGNFALFMMNVRKNYDEAEQLYRRALELELVHADNNANFACLLLAREKIDEAIPVLQLAWQIKAGEAAQCTAEVTLYAGLIALFRGRDDRPALGRLKALLAQGFERGSYSFDSILTFAKSKLSPADHTLYTALGDAILDPEKIPRLEQFERWRSIAPIPLDASWAVG